MHHGDQVRVVESLELDVIGRSGGRSGRQVSERSGQKSQIDAVFCNVRLHACASRMIKIIAAESDCRMSLVDPGMVAVLRSNMWVFVPFCVMASLNVNESRLLLVLFKPVATT